MRLRTLFLVSLLSLPVLAADVEVQKTPTPKVKSKKVLTSSAAKKPGDAVSLNPQPLPPKDATAIKTNKGDAVSLNPQPLPPKDATAMKVNKGDAVSLNPQPLPPKDATAVKTNSGDAVSLNPQPLPPKAKAKVKKGEKKVPEAAVQNQSQQPQ